MTEAKTVEVSQADREELERDIRISIWNGAKWQGSPDEVAQSLIRKVMDEPCMVRALDRLASQSRSSDKLREALSGLSRAAYDYAGNYLLDERDDPDLCAMWPNQHERIVALFDAIEDADASLSSSGEG